jgi:DNA mismatch repair protein MutL
MGKIVQLPEEVFSKIAAGEVIERPANAVKEIIENSLDAYSKNIKIRILNSGLKLIEVRDDGIGIEYVDLPLTINRYATSKIKSEKDLLNISTFGFRGEALYAISKVSNLYITSKTKESDKTYILYASEGKILSLKEELINYFENGTIVKVVDLFFNSPVRRNFISSNKVENYNIINIVKQLACINYKVAFSLYIDDRLVFNYLPTDNLINRVKEVFKNNNLDEYSLKIENYEVILILSNIFKENLKKSKGSTKGNIYFYVNGRVVGDGNYSLVKLIKSTFDEMLNDRYYIEGIVSLNLPPDEIDVNIHPRKFDVRFLKPIFVKNLIQKSTKEFINNKVKTTFSFLEKEEEKINRDSPNQWYINLKNNQKNDKSLSNQLDDKDIKKEITNLNKPENTTKDEVLSSFVSNLIKKIEKITKEENKKELKQIDLRLDKSSKLDNSSLGNDLKPSDFQKEFQHQKEIEKKDKEQGDFKLLFYWDKTYFLMYYNEAFYIVDQHNAHEKIIYSTLLNKINLYPQKLLIPIEIPFNDLEINIIEFISNSKLDFEYIIKELGFDINILQDKLIINAYPSIFNNNYTNFTFDIKSSFLNLLGLFSGVSLFDKDRLIKEVVAIFACKSAVKAGIKLNENEIIYLFENILKLDTLNPNFCPHGRNAIIRIDFKQINKLFERH